VWGTARQPPGSTIPRRPNRTPPTRPGLGAKRHPPRRFLISGRDLTSVRKHSNDLLRLLGISIKVVYSEIGKTRPGPKRGYEHFGFLDGISQPGIRGLPRRFSPTRNPDQELPGQDLIWPGEFVFGYPGQHRDDPVKEGPRPPMAAPWMRNGSCMAFRALGAKSTRISPVCRGPGGAVGDGLGIVRGADGRALEERLPVGACTAARRPQARRRREAQQ
jgi:hypothetical protein